jgi:hypothetical protein
MRRPTIEGATRRGSDNTGPNEDHFQIFHDLDCAIVLDGASRAGGVAKRVGRQFERLVREQPPASLPEWTRIVKLLDSFAMGAARTTFVGFRILSAREAAGASRRCDARAGETVAGPSTPSSAPRRFERFERSGRVGAAAASSGRLSLEGQSSGPPTGLVDDDEGAPLEQIGARSYSLDRWRESDFGEEISKTRSRTLGPVA